MAEENNLTANELYFEKVENEQGLELSLEETLQQNLVALLTDRYVRRQLPGIMMKADG